MPEPETFPAAGSTPGPASGSPPWIRSVGVTGMLVTFSEALEDDANRAAIALAAALRQLDWTGIEEVSSTLASAYIRFDPLTLDHATLRVRLSELVESRDWRGAALPAGRRIWRIPAVLGGPSAPQWDEACAAAGLSDAEARRQIAAAELRVLACGFAPGQPYLGELPPAWNIPRQTELTAEVPQGALIAAIRQLVLFTAPAPTGWRHIGQTAFRNFRPGANDPIALRPGDTVTFRITDDAEIAALDGAPNGGAEMEVVS